MAKYDKQSSARLPLMESVIIVSIFAIVSVTIMQMYVSADRIQGRAVAVSKAMILAENVAEGMHSEGKIPELGISLEDAAELAGTTVSVLYDKSWNVTGDDPDYVLSFTPTVQQGDTGVLVEADIRVAEADGGELASLKGAAILNR